MNKIYVMYVCPLLNPFLLIHIYPNVFNGCIFFKSIQYVMRQDNLVKNHQKENCCQIYRHMDHPVNGIYLWAA